MEFEAQPATITPYTPMDVMAMTYSRPALTLASTTSGPKGTTAQAASAGIRVTTGATTNSTLLASLGTTTSLVSSLNTSAKGCSSPEAHAVRSHADVHGADHLAFPVRQVRDAQDDGHCDHDDLDDRPQNQPDRRAEQRLALALENIKPFHQARSTLI